MPHKPKTDKEWQAEMDAETLASGAAIRADKPRMAAAKRAAGKLAKDQQVRATAMKSIARKPSKPTRRK